LFSKNIIITKIILSACLYKRKMLKSFSRGFTTGFSKFFTTERVALLVVFLILAYALYAYSGYKSLRMDTMADGSAAPSTAPSTAPSLPTVPVVSSTPSASSAGATPAAQPSSGYTAQSVAAPQDLLPQDQNSQWAALNPVAQGNIATPDLLQAGYHIGLDTIGQTLRNANLQERSDPVIPKSQVGPWNQSTIEPDLGRVPLEVGVGGR
jgi:hypothetical protein